MLRSTLLTIACSASLAAHAIADTKQIDVPAGEMIAALEKLSTQIAVELVYQAEQLKGLRTQGVSGELSSEEAVTRLLEGTPLQLKIDASGAMLVTLPRAPASSFTESVTSTPHAAEGGDSVLAEVVVSAQKQGDQRLQDVPVPVSVLNSDTLSGTGQTLLRDYFTSVPGFSVSPNIENTQMLSIRGISTGGFSNPTVGVLIDDVPYGASTGDGDGNAVPDFDPGDLARIEVLRGPQGTLYGANSMGGLLRYVTKDPAFDAFGGRVEAGTHSVRHGDEPGYHLRASVNVPVSDTFAVRASGFTRKDAGYIDNAFLGREDINDARVSGARVAAFWRPSNDFSLKLSAIYQDTSANAPTEVDAVPGLGDWEQNYVAGVGGYERKVQAYSATIDYRIGDVDVASVTGYNANTSRVPFDFTSILGDFTRDGVPGTGFAGFGVTGTPWHIDYDVTKFTQELRFSVPLTQKLEWLAGGFYTHEHKEQHGVLSGGDPLTGQSFGQTWDFDVPSTFEEYAAFTDFTYHFTDRFDVQFGGRQSHTSYGTSTSASGPFTILFLGQPSPVFVPTARSEADTFTYLLTPRFKVSPDLMVYARLASGFRPGGPNAYIANAPSQYEPDKTQNYELGVKGSVLNRMLSYDMSLYYIDWKDLQIQLFTPENVPYGANGSRAKSAGIELALTARPFSGFTVSAWGAYDDAVLQDAFPAQSTAAGRSGDRLPNVPRFSGNLSVEQLFPLGGNVSGFVGGAFSYVGERVSIFQGFNGVGAPLPRQRFPSYTKTDFRAGVNYGTWTASVYVNNLTDVRGLLNGGAGYTLPYAFIYTQPRTLGLNLVKSF